uniref:YitT family protein n=2 Tax=Ralstonia pickettii TaxID=329 RepID=C6BL93_RALP1
MKALEVTRHSTLEDVLAIVTGTLFVSLGITLFKQGGLLSGGTAGVAFLIHYATSLPFGAVFFTINLPFYYLAVRRMGWRFTCKTFCAVALVSWLSEVHAHFVHLDTLNPLYAGAIGGTLMGVGLIVLFRHQASLGGVNIVALYLQEKYGIRAGKFQMAVDVGIVLTSLFVVSPMALAASLVGAVALNLSIALNHRPGRYPAAQAALGAAPADRHGPHKRSVA